eukprot:tig00020684_g12856.t1
MRQRERLTAADKKDPDVAPRGQPPSTSVPAKKKENGYDMPRPRAGPPPGVPSQTAAKARQVGLKRRRFGEDGYGLSFVNFDKVEASTLRRYCDHYRLSVPPNSPKSLLVQMVSKHFSELKVEEHEVIATFVNQNPTPYSRKRNQ